MNDKVIERVSQFLLRELFTKLEDVAILQHEDGTYEFFNRYSIKKENNDMFRVSLKYNSDIKQFSSLKNAVTWCVFDYRNKFSRANRIEYLDKMIVASELNIAVHKNLARKTHDIDTKLIFLAKLNEDQVKRKTYLEEMFGYFRESKQLQTQKFSTK